MLFDLLTGKENGVTNGISGLGFNVGFTVGFNGVEVVMALVGIGRGTTVVTVAG